MELHKIAIRVLFAYVVLQALMRLSGKRVVSEAGSRDFVVALVIGDLIDDLFWAEVGAAKFTVAAGSLVVTGILVALITYMSPVAARLVDGRSQLLLRDGAPVAAGGRAERINEEELAGLLRTRGIDRQRWTEVEHARLEENGELSVALYEWARPAERQDRDRVRREKTP